ncbi:MAG: hypothetical protein E7K72_27630, partial [Roseomonas mucosa]|nr:hypothetical protein [Roseomonas mucosa]
SGHTGWRGSTFLSGEELFSALQSVALTGWHARREAAQKAGIDPDTVELIFVDNLDGINALVAPARFTLRRSRSRPLLMMYQIEMVVLDPEGGSLSIVDSIINALTNPTRWLAGVFGLESTIGTLDSYASSAFSILGAASEAPGRLAATVAGALGSVKDLAEQSTGIFTGAGATVASATQSLTRAARGAFSALAGAEEMSDTDRAQFMELSAATGDAMCVMANSFNLATTYPSYESLYGASMCSSTGGGRAASEFASSDRGALDSLYPAETSRVTITAQAREAMTALRADPIELAKDPAQVADLIERVVAGVTIA